MLQYVTIDNYTTKRGIQYTSLDISYQVFGRELHTAPIVVVFHALTGNSDVCSEEYGWWKELIGHGRCIDLDHYTVIGIDLLGNGYNGTLIDQYQDFVAADIAALTHIAFRQISIHDIHTLIGGSLGGGIVWEYLAAYPQSCRYAIPIAADWKSTDWLMGITGVQEKILQNSSSPINDAREMAMLFYRTPASLTRKFGRKKQNPELYQVNSWLQHHGNKLEKRFDVKAYLMMNHLLSTIDVAPDEKIFVERLKNTSATIVQIAIDSDILFPQAEIARTATLLDNTSIPHQYHEIHSEDGHDAFLIEFQQLATHLKPIFEL